MKIFNWVQRKFHHDSLKEGLAQNVKKVESIANDADKQALLKQVALIDVLDDWKDGILTIGTLGFEPLRSFTQQNEYVVLESDQEHEEEEEEEEEDEEEEEEEVGDNNEKLEKEKYSCSVHGDAENEELNPLIFTTIERNFVGIAHDFYAKGAGSDETMTMDSFTPDNSGDFEIDQRKKKGERTTLAELFEADSEMKKKADCCEIEYSSGKKSADRAKNGLSFAKKLLPHVREELRPMKRIQRLMRKMLKRKIHPDLEGKICELNDRNKIGPVKNQGNKGEEAAESVSLLRTGTGQAI